MSNDALVLAHGAFHGPWCWTTLIECLQDRGVRCLAVDLDRGGVEADRDALQTEVDRLRSAGHRVHAIGHSLGCTSVAGLDPATLATAILLAGPVAPGEGLPPVEELLLPGFLDGIQRVEDGRSRIEREHARAVFYHRCSEDRAGWALDRLRPTFLHGPAPGAPALWEQLPVTYVVCDDDRAVAPAYQRRVAERMPAVARLDADHSPMIGQPGALAEVVLEAMARA